MSIWYPQHVLYQLDRLIDQVAGGEPGNGRSVTFAPHVDIKETQNGYDLFVELPGLSAGDVDIAVDRGVLTISGERKAPEAGENEAWRLRETNSGVFSRRFTLGDAVDAENIAAEMDAGVLRVSIAKKPKAVPRKIEVKVN
ncbi:Hsp20/alpha crystallin family protein [bacterium]|nr:Hsp20/alpha crystallin family protein [bacterium]